jgi:hypothetical protein
MSRSIRILWLLVLFLYACVPQPAETNPEQVTVTNTALPAVLTSTSTVQPVDMLTPTEASPTEPPQTPSLIPPPSPSLIFHNGVVLSMEEGLPFYEAIAILDNTIILVGSNADILALAGSDTRMIDLQGLTLMPGFVDPHTHILNDAQDHMGLNLVQAQDLAFENGITTIGDMFVNQDFLQRR